MYVQNSIVIELSLVLKYFLSINIKSILVSYLKLFIMYLSETTTLEELENLQIGDFLADEFNEGKIESIYSKNNGEFKEFDFVVSRKEMSGMLKRSKISFFI